MSNTIGLPIQKDYLIEKDTYIRSFKKADRGFEVEVGDEKQPGKFEPQAKFKLFDNRVNFSVRYDAKGRPGVNDKAGTDKILYRIPGETVEFYETARGFEIAILLNDKPASNEFEFTLQDKNVAYYFQKDLDDMDPAERALYPADAEQPEHIKNSYAVYANSRPDGLADDDFKNGKIGHIYRVFAQDADGVRVWCSMIIANGRLKITVPVSFLESAKYPVEIDPDFGFTTAGGTPATISATTKNTCDDQASRHHTATAGQQIASVSFYGNMNGGVGSGLIEVGVYDMSTGNDPSGATLNSSADCSISGASAAWHTSADIDVAITSGNNYAVAIGDARPTGGTIKGYYDALGGDQVAESSTTGALDATFNNDDGHLTYIFSAYATVEAVPGPPTFSGTIPDQVFARTDSVSIPTASYFTEPETYSAANLPAFLSINTSTGEITNNSANVNGTYTNISVTCSNAESPPTATSNTFTITINAQKPIWTGSVNNQSGNVGVAIAPLDVSALVDHATSYAATGIPAGITVDSGTGIATGTPTTEQSYLGAYFTATNADGPEDSNTFTWAIGPALPIPTITSVNSGNGIPRGESFDIVGTNFEAVQGTGSITLGGLTLTVNSWSDTTINCDGPDEGLAALDAAYPLVVTNDQGYSNATNNQTWTAQANYQTQTSAVNYGQLPSDSFLYQLAGLENLAVGDQAVLSNTASPSGTVTIDDQMRVALTGVSTPGDYTFNYEIYDVSDQTISSNGTSVITYQASGDDLAAPTWVSSPAVSSVDVTSATFAATISETGDIYAVLVEQSESDPTVDQVIAGQNAAGGTPLQALSATATTSISEALSYSEGLQLKVCAAAQDDETTPNKQSSVTIVNFEPPVTPDTTPPTWSVAPAVTQVTTTTATLNAEINEAGVISWVVIPGEWADPSPAEIISNQMLNLSGEVEPAPYSGSGSAIQNYLLSSLSPGQLFKFATAAADTSNNVQLTSTVVQFTTSPLGSTRSVNSDLKDDDTGQAVASTLLDYCIQSAFDGAVTDTGQVTTDGSGNYSITNLNVAAGSAWITFKDAATGLKVATGPITVTEA